MPQRVFAGNMWPMFNFDDPNVRYTSFLGGARPAFKTAIESLVLYNELIIPTDDFMSLAALVGTLGEASVVSLIESRSIRFVRVKGALGYCGNGAGLQYFTIGSDQGDEKAFCAGADKAIHWALTGLAMRLQNPQLPELVLQATEEIDLQEIWEGVRHETYMDILNSDHLRNYFAVRNTELNALEGIQAKEVRIFGGPNSEWRADEIGIVLALAATNLELRMLQAVEASDASTACPVGHALRAKAERGYGEQAARSFAVLREIAEIPDLGESILLGSVPIQELIRLRESRSAEQFRAWFHENCRTDPVATGKEYARLLRQVSGIQSFSARVLRFLVTTAIGYLPGGSALGTVAGGIDSFLVDRWFRGQSPKVFIDDLRQLR